MPFHFCPQCGTKLQPGFRFCPSCGEKLPSVADESGPVSSTVSPPRRDEVPVLTKISLASSSSPSSEPRESNGKYCVFFNSLFQKLDYLVFFNSLSPKCLFFFFLQPMHVPPQLQLQLALHCEKPVTPFVWTGKLNSTLKMSLHLWCPPLMTRLKVTKVVWTQFYLLKVFS